MIRFSLLVVSLVLLLIGMFILFGSVTRGIDAANAYLSTLGGGMDTTQFTIVMLGYIHTYQWIGGILSAIGGLGMIRSIEPQSKE